MRLTLLQGGRPVVRTPRPVKAAPVPAAEPMITVPQRTIENLIREFHELRAMWASFERKHPRSRAGKEVCHG